MNPALGVDPGAHSGAAVLLAADGRRVLRWWSWIRVVRGLRLRTVEDGQPSVAVLEDHLALADAFALAMPRSCLLSVEGLFWKSDRPELHALFETTGALRIRLERASKGAAFRPLASAWRPEILGIPATLSAEKAEAAAIRLARSRWQWERPGPLAAGAGPVEVGAIAESAAIAAYAQAHAHEVTP